MNDNPATVISPIRIIGQGVAPGHQRIQSVPDRPTGSFQRLVNGGSFELVNFQPGKILYFFKSWLIKLWRNNLTNPFHQFERKHTDYREQSEVLNT